MFRMFLITVMLNLFSILPVKAQECMSMHVVLNTVAGYTDEVGNITGFHVDFLTALEEEAGLCMDKNILPYSRAKRSLQIGAHDGGILARSSNPDNDIEYITKLLSSKTVIIPKKGLSLNSYQDLSKITIARVRRVNLGTILDDDPNLQFVDVTDYEHGLKMLRRGRVDAIAGNALGLSTTIDNLNMFEDINLADKLVISEREVWFALSKKSNYINKIDQLRVASQSLIDKGVLDNILEKYFGEKWKLVD